VSPDVGVGLVRAVSKEEEGDESVMVAGILDAGGSIEEFAHRRRTIGLLFDVPCSWH
jgi:hypothetical protein